MTLYGVDVSHYQSTKAPGGAPWSLLAQTARFVIVRATYGTYRDPSAVEHVRAARAVGMQVGLYHFFRVGQPITDQVAAFCGQALACGYKVGDICPALDIEDDPRVAEVSPSWDTAAQAMADGLAANFGDVLLYITQRDFGRLGKPDWVLSRPLWTAHYTGAPKPATPGNKPCAIWQCRVGPYVADGPGGAFQPMVLDQNRADGPLPLATRVAGASGSTPPPPAGPEPDHSHEDLIAARLATITSSDDFDGHSSSDVTL
jgi:hypothetical protein